MSAAVTVAYRLNMRRKPFKHAIESVQRRVRWWRLPVRGLLPQLCLIFSKAGSSCQINQACLFPGTKRVDVILIMQERCHIPGISPSEPPFTLSCLHVLFELALFYFENPPSLLCVFTSCLCCVFPPILSLLHPDWFHLCLVVLPCVVFSPCVSLCDVVMLFSCSLFFGLTSRFLLFLVWVRFLNQA